MRDSESSEGDPELTIPVQPGLRFEVSLYLYGDALHVCAGEFSGEWFSSTRSEVVSQYVDAVTGLLEGRLRIVEHFRGERLVKAFLQRPMSSGWANISRYYRGFSLPWLRTRQRVLQNLATEPRSVPLDLLS